jgi:aryl-alcohol dehydrogenase-like predicted oxidoreductase
VDYQTGVKAAAEFTELVNSYGPEGLTPAQVAIAWVCQQPGVSTVIPGARNPNQAQSNAAAGSAPALSHELLQGVQRIYDTYFREAIHPLW